VRPCDAHRCLLVGGALAARGLAIGHLLVDGRVEPHTATEQRLLALAGPAPADLFDDAAARLDHAYRRRAKAVAARAKPWKRRAMGGGWRGPPLFRRGRKARF